MRFQPAVSFLLVVGLAACASYPTGKFPAQAPVWNEPDQRPFAEPPEGFYSSFTWDFMDYTMFRPMARVWTFPVPRVAMNVNAWDEVPNSSWFTNRIGVQPMTPEQVGRGACEDDVGPSGHVPWEVWGGKPDGSNPGFLAKDTRGVRFLVKTGFQEQPERPSAADVIGALLFHAAGYWVPCNGIAYIKRSDLRLGEGAEAKESSGHKRPLTWDDIDNVVESARSAEPPGPGGTLRFSTSEFVKGRPISAWRYEGIREDDPNDNIPHEHRRELRGMKLLAAWIDHVDTRQENTLATWMDVGDGVGYVRHYKIDFGDALGIIQGPAAIPPRIGHSHYFHVGHILSDFFSLGLIDRPWYHAEFGPTGRTLAYYDARRFDADDWKEGYPNPAFSEAMEADYAWITRIIARITPEHLAAIVKRAKFTVPHAESEVLRILKERRVKMLERYLTRLSPLAWPKVEGRRVCLQDLAVWTGIRADEARRYEAKMYSGEAYEHMRPLETERAEDSRVCFEIPSDADPYAIVDIVASTDHEDPTYPARLHFYTDRSDLLLAGIERPDDDGAPEP